MTQKLIFACVVALAAAGVVLGERHAVRAEVSPAPILYFVSDTERELTRIPVSLTRISDKEEIAAGDEMARVYLDATKKDETPESRISADYVSQVGGKVAHRAHRQLPYKFHYIDEDSLVNAFALPGGHVFIGKGLLTLMQTEDELASVLGHEVEHVDLGHCAERVQIETRLKHLPLGEAAALPIEMFQAGYSKDQELEADREGTKLAVASGYSPEGAISMFQRFQKLEDQWQDYARAQRQPTPLELPGVIVNVVVFQGLEGYFRSHPSESERIAQIQQLIAAEHWPQDQKQQPLQIAYLLRTDEAEALLQSGDIDKASKKADESLALRPGYFPTLNVLGNIAFEQARFPDAAQMYAKSLQLNPQQDAVAQKYATSLSASLPPEQAAAQYSRWLESTPPAIQNNPSFLVEQVGLRLLGGDTQPAKTFAEELAKSEIDNAPVLIGRLGWWYFRANDLPTAETTLQSAIEQRPQMGFISCKLGWALMAQKKFQSAHERFEMAAGDSDPLLRAEAQMGQAVAEWDTKQPDLALVHYRSAVNDRKAWRNSQWIAALYGPAISASVQAMQHEDELRTQAARRAQQR
jgi:predicted Zn-dependent protease